MSSNDGPADSRPTVVVTESGNITLEEARLRATGVVWRIFWI
jgi:hypothetical protein